MAYFKTILFFQTSEAPSNTYNSNQNLHHINHSTSSNGHHHSLNINEISTVAALNKAATTAAAPATASGHRNGSHGGNGNYD